MRIRIPVEAERIIEVLENNGFEAWLVGGCVRDFLMDIEPKDFDICTSAPPEKVACLFEKNINTGIKHGTVTVLENNRPFQVTTYRVDSKYTDHRRPDNVSFSNSLEEDLKRRDFTINAIAYHPVKGIIDPHNGKKDILNRIIRTVGSPEKRFSEDALRMLRAIRFKARLGFDIHPEIKKSMLSLADTLKFVSRERILAEINEILLSPFPEAILELFDTGLITYIFPLPVPAVPDMKAFSNLEKKLHLRWAALFWQMGFSSNTDIEYMCRDLKMSKALTREILIVTDILNKPLPNSGYLLRFILSAAGLEKFSDCINIYRNYGVFVKEVNSIEKCLNVILENEHCIRLEDLAVDGNQLKASGFIPGKQLGDLIQILFLCVLQNPALNNHDILLAFAEHINHVFPQQPQNI